MKELIIAGKKVSNKTKTLIIAEAGINHDGKYEQAIELIDVAANSGADIVKFQLFKAKKMYTEKAGNYKTANGTIAPINDILKETELPENWIPKLMNYCEKKGIGFLCTVCDEDGGRILNDYGVDAFKIASSGVTHLPLIENIATYMKTMIFSTAAAFVSDIDIAVRAIKSKGNNDIAIMHCLYRYPTPVNECNLNFIKTLQYLYPDCVIGYSDHTEDPICAPVTAVVLGAKIIEKHFTIDKTLPGADHCYSLNPEELTKMCKEIRRVESLSCEDQMKEIVTDCLGTTGRALAEAELSLRDFGYRCIFATQNIKKGDIITNCNSAVLRPGNSERGIEPYMYNTLIDKGVKVTRDISAGNSIKWDDILNF